MMFFVDSNNLLNFKMIYRFIVGLALIACEAAATEIQVMAKYYHPGYTSNNYSSYSPSAYQNYNNHDSGHFHAYGGHNSPVDVWGIAASDKEGWWSSTQQYSPPMIPYKPYECQTGPIFAQCDIATQSITGRTEDVTLQFIQ